MKERPKFKDSLLRGNFYPEKSIGFGHMKGDTHENFCLC